MGAMLARATARGTLAQIRYVEAVAPRAARGLVAEVYGQVGRDFGMLAPPTVLHAPAPEVLAAAWLLLRETLIASSRASRAAKETVATGVSLGNTCPYCVDVHSTALRGLVSGRHAEAMSGNRLSAVSARRGLRDLAHWARASGSPGGAQPVPAPPEQAAELVGVAMCFHYLNRMVNVFLVDSPLPGRVPAPVRYLAGWLTAPFLLHSRAPGAAIHLLRRAKRPADLAWADADPRLAEGLARAVGAFDDAGARSVPGSVRDLVVNCLAEWDGRPPSIGRGWVDATLAALPADERPAGRLALMTALASYRIGPSIIDEYRKGQPDDRSLIELTAWASMAAARRVGSWMTGDTRTTPGSPAGRPRRAWDHLDQQAVRA